MTTCKHYMNDRQYREQLIKFLGQGKVIGTFYLDRGHWHGLERHELTDNGIIIIYNNTTGELLTKLIARPAQIKRYYPNGDYPRKVVQIAREHTEAGYNHC